MKEYRIANSATKTYIIFNDYNSARNYIMDTMLADNNTYLLDETPWTRTSHRSNKQSKQILFVIVDPITRTATRKSMTICEAERDGDMKADWKIEWHQ